MKILKITWSLLALWCCLSLQVGAQVVDATWTDFYNTQDNAGHLSLTVSPPAKGHAFSQEELCPERKGYAEVTIENLNNYYRFGLVNTPLVAGGGNANVFYGFYISRNRLWYVDGSVPGWGPVISNGTNNFGSITGYLGRLRVGDVLRVERIEGPNGAEIILKKNGVTFYTNSTDFSLKLRVWEEIYRENSPIEKVQVLFPSCRGIRIGATVRHYVCDPLRGGYIALSISGGVAPYDVNWSNGEHTQVISDLPPGEYHVSVQDALGVVHLASFEIMTEVSWQASSLNGLEINPPSGSSGYGIYSTIDKEPCTNSWFDNGARSSEHIPASEEGCVEYTSNDYSGGFMFGLSKNDPFNVMSIDYAFICLYSSLYIFENGSFVGSFGALSPHDKLKIERVGSNINYYLNGVIVRQTAAISDELYLDLAVGVCPRGVVYDKFLMCNAECAFVRTIPQPYAIPKKKLDGNYHTLAEDYVLRFKYEEKYNTDELNYKLYDKYRTIVMDGSLLISHRDNWMEILIDQSLSAGEFYVMELEGGKDNKELIRIYIR